jgi:hypothetical protein
MVNEVVENIYKGNKMKFSPIRFKASLSIVVIALALGAVLRQQIVMP